MYKKAYALFVNCPICKVEFMRHRRSTVTCGAKKCQNTWYYRNNKKSQIGKIKKCLYCKKEMVIGNGNQKFCQTNVDAKYSYCKSMYYRNKKKEG